MSNVSINLKKQERQKIKQQERLLIDLAKEFIKLLSDSGKTESELKQYLGQNDAFITGVKHGFGNIRMRELADIFTFFNKKVFIKPIEIDNKCQFIQIDNNIPCYKIEHPLTINKDIDNFIVIAIDNKSEHKGQVKICFDRNNDILETSGMIENNFNSTYNTVLKSKMGVKNER